MFPRISDLINTVFGTTLQWPVYTYGLFLAGAFAASFVWVYLDLKDKSLAGVIPHGSERYTLLFAVVVLLSAFIGLKLFHYLDYPDQFLNASPGSLLSIGGLSFYGGLIFGTLAVIATLLFLKIPLPAAGDVAAPAICIGYAVGRLGCHLSGDGCWGMEVRSPDPGWWLGCSFPHNVVNQGIPMAGCSGDYCRVLPAPVYPTSLYESLLSLCLFALLLVLRKRNPIPGALFSLYLVLGSAMRFLIEFIRINPRYRIGDFMLSQAQIVSLFLILAGVGSLWLFRRSFLQRTGRDRP